MKKKKIIIGSVVTMLTLGAGLSSVYAFQGGFGPNNEDRDKMKEAVENNDYDAWKGLMESRITEENFSKMREMHQNREKVREAIENKDYSAFQEAIKDSPMQDQLEDKITEENFDEFVEMHNLREEGKYDEARAIADELGLEKPGMGPGHGGFGGHRKGF